jgi:glycosyltransferase involved in cell wall biosynthesis
LRTACEIAPETPLLVYSGALTSRRHLHVVIRALPALDDVHLALAVRSDHKRVAEWRRVAAKHGVAERVHVVPLVPPESIVPYVAQANVGVNPLDRYLNGDLALPNKLFEFLHAGVPMVVSDSPLMSAFVQEHGLGEVAPVSSVKAWAKAIALVLANPDRYRGDADAREALLAEWSWETQEERLLAVYEELLGRRLPVGAGAAMRS